MAVPLVSARALAARPCAVDSAVPPTREGDCANTADGIHACSMTSACVSCHATGETNSATFYHRRSRFIPCMQATMRGTQLACGDGWCNTICREAAKTVIASMEVHLVLALGTCSHLMQ